MAGDFDQGDLRTHISAQIHQPPPISKFPLTKLQKFLAPLQQSFAYASVC